MLLGAVFSLPAFAAFDLDELMRTLGSVRAGQARFVEQRHVKGLDDVLQASGTLSFESPDRFTRQTLLPRPESLVVEGNTVTFTRGGRSRSMALDASPQVLPVVEAMRATLTGSAATLKKHFEPTLSGSLDQWTLDLAPRERGLGVPLRSVRIQGRQGEVRGVELWMTDGDWSVMTIEPVATRTPRAASAP